MKILIATLFAVALIALGAGDLVTSFKVTMIFLWAIVAIVLFTTNDSRETWLKFIGGIGISLVVVWAFSVLFAIRFLWGFT